MKVLIVRHAKADDREAFAATGKPDDLRPLTESGRKQARKAGRALKDQLPRVDVLGASPLLRTLETARLIAREYRHLAVKTVPELAPGFEPQAVAQWLAKQPANATVALVGHEPELSQLAGWLLTGRAEPLVELKKGAACLLDFPGKLAPGRGVLAWLLSPVQLRRLGGD